MARRRKAWTESEVAALGPGEYDFREFKGSHFLAEHGEVHGSFLTNYAKQVSAFANGAGGTIFIGVDDRGCIDGGLPVDLKSGGLRAWLEDVTPGAVDPPLAAFNVFEVRSDGTPGSAIRPGHAVFVVEVPSSDSAPHQALDHRYYLRIAGKSRPMGHVHVGDVLRRTRHPVVDLVRLGPYGEPEYDVSDPRGPRVLVSLRAFLHNTGRNLGHHVGGEIILPRPLVNSVCRQRMLDYDGILFTQKPGELVFFKYHPSPLFPGQQAFFQRVWIAIHANNIGLLNSGGALTSRIWADDAEPKVGAVPLNTFRVVRRAMAWVEHQGRQQALPGTNPGALAPPEPERPTEE
jgi:hypothetical protein